MAQHDYSAADAKSQLDDMVLYEQASLYRYGLSKTLGGDPVKLAETQAQLDGINALRTRFGDVAAVKIIGSTKENKDDPNTAGSPDVKKLLLDMSNLEKGAPANAARTQFEKDLATKISDDPKATFIDTLQAALKGNPQLLKDLEDKMMNHPEELEAKLDRLIQPGADIAAIVGEAPAQAKPVKNPTPTPTPVATPTSTPRATPTPAATPTPTPAAVPAGAQALGIMMGWKDRPDFKALVTNLQTNHPELAEALGVGPGSNGTPDPKKLAPLLPALKKLDAAAQNDPQYFQTLSDQLDAAKANAPQTYAQIVDTAKNHPEKLADTLGGAQSQFNMMSGIQEMGNKIGSYLGFDHLGDMLAGLFKWIIGIPIIGPMIGGLMGNLMGSLGNLTGSAQNGNLQGASNTNFSLAHETIPGTVQDANNLRTYTLKGKLDDKQTTELDGMLKKDDATNDTYNYDKATDTTTVRTTTNFKMPVAP